MLKANELRIGNIVKYKCYTIKVVLIGEYGIQGVEEDVVINAKFRTGDIKPIQLTEDILLKCGWLWNENCKSFEGKDTRMNLQYRDVNGSYTMFNYVLKAIIIERIFYVHQLQNLYFALTNEELIINL